MVIPQKDLLYALPVRWAFHMWATKDYPIPSNHRWKFQEWREYLLSWDESGFELFFYYLGENGINGFLSEYKEALVYFNATTLLGAIKFWIKCCDDYKKLLAR